MNFLKTIITYGSRYSKILAVILFTGIQTFLLAATITSKAVTNGDWNSQSTWVGDVVPTALDDVVIAAGSSVILRDPWGSANPALCNSITIDGTLIFGGSTTSVRRLDVTTYIIINATGIVTNNGLATHLLNIGGDWTNNGTFTPYVDLGATQGSIQVTFNGTGTQTIDGHAAQSFRTMIVNKTAGQVLQTSGSVTTIDATSLTVSSGTFSSPANLSVTGNITLSGGTLNAGNAITLTGNFSNSGTFNSGTGTVTFNGSSQLIGGSVSTTFNHVVINGSNTTTDIATTIGGNLTVNSNSTLTVGGFNFTVTGTTSIGGTVVFTSINGSKLFGGLVNVQPTGIWDNTVVAESFRFTGGITNSGTFTAGTGTYTFDTNAQTLTGTLSIPTVVVTAIALTNSNTFTVATSLSGSGSLIQAPNAILNLGGSMSSSTGLDATTNSNTVNYTGAAQTIRNVNYHNLSLSGSDVKTLQGSTSNIAGSLSLSGMVSTTTATTMTIGSLTVGDDCVFTAAGFTLTVNGPTTVGNGNSGMLLISSTAGTKTFSGLLTINSGATWNNSIGENITLHSGITKDGTFTAGSGTYNFALNEQTLTGNFVLETATVASGATLINSGSLVVSTLSGAGTLRQGDFSTLTVSNLTITGLVATAPGNTVRDSGIGNPKEVNYTNLHLYGTGVRNLLPGTTNISGDLLILSTITTSTSTALSIGGNLGVGSSATLNVTGFDLTVAGTTSIDGTINFPSSVGTKVFGGLVTVSTGATWNNSTNNESLTFRGGILNSGNFMGGTSTQTFDTNNQTLTGDFTLPRVAVNGITLTVLNDLIISTILSGTGNIAMGALTYIELDGNATLGSFIAPDYGSYVLYADAAPAIIPGTYGNLGLNQSSGSASLIGATEVRGALQLLNGNLNIGTHVLTLGDTASIYNPNPSATSMIIASGGGEIRKKMTATGSFDFPVGDITATPEYSPVTVNLTAATSFNNAYLSVAVTDAKHPSNNSTTNFLTRYWSIGQSGLTDAVATVIGNYTLADITGSQSNISSAQLEGILNITSNPWKKRSALGSNTLYYSDATLTGGQISVFSGISLAGPTVVITGGSISICANTSTQLGATVTGDPTLTYEWSPSTGLSSVNVVNPTATVASTTNYTLTVYDGNGIKASDNTTITTQQPIITANDITICEGTSGALTASGAVSYTWSPSTNLSATTGATVDANPTTTTTYTVTGTDGNSCQNTKQVTVNVNPKPTISAANITICDGSSGTLSASGAVSYTWSPATNLSTTTGATVNANPTTTTSYTVTGTDANSCQNTKQVTVNVNPKPNVTVNSPTVCAGTPVALTANGASSYTWSPATGLSATTGNPVTATLLNTASYTVTGTDLNNCTNTATATVTITPLPNKPTIVGSDLGSISPTLTSSSTTGNQWYKDGNVITGATLQTLEVTEDGSYTVTVTSGGCSSLASDAYVIVITGLGDEPTLLKLYPNPAKDLITIEWTGFSSDKAIQIRIVDMLGRVVMSRSMTTADENLNIESISKGQHILLASQGNKNNRIRFSKE